MTIDISDLRSAFFEEASEHLVTMEASLLALEQQPNDPELINQVFRAAHSIKGASGTFGFDDLLKFTHALEGLLHRVREGSLALTPPLNDLLLRATDVLGSLVSSTRRGEPPEKIVETLNAEILAAVPKGSKPPAPDADEHPVDGFVLFAIPADDAPARRTFRIAFDPGPDLFLQGMDPGLVVRDLLDLGDPIAIGVDMSGLPGLDALDPERSYLRWNIDLSTDRSEAELRDVFAFVEDVSRIEIACFDAPAVADATAPADAVAPEMATGPAAPAPMPKASPASPSSAEPAHAQVVVGKRQATAERSTVRVDTEKIDKILDIVGELVIAQSMVAAAMVDSTAPGAQERLHEAVLAAERNTRELQDRVMAIRMIPMGTIFNRFPRMVRDLGASLGKEVELVLDGEEVELDKGMVEKLADPLTHLVRNAVDHGIESPQERQKLGKRESGTVSIVAVHQSGNVIIDVTDDGSGLPTEKIRDKARALGLIAPDAEPTSDELHALIFAPGFSTKDQVTDVSGRGVGMDVVKRNVEALSGSISFTSERGVGSRMRIRLPLTVAIIEGLMLRVGSQVFVVPLIEVVESLRPSRAQYQRILGHGEVVRVRDQAVPLVRLHHALGVAGAQTDACKALVCIVEVNGARVGLLVDELLGQAQVVVKTLETNFRRIEGTMGATILGDGRVALILDIQGVVKRAAVAGRRKETSHDAIGNVA